MKTGKECDERDAYGQGIEEIFRVSYTECGLGFAAFLCPVLLNILVAVIKESSHIRWEWRSLFKRPAKARFSFINLASSSCYPSIITSGGEVGCAGTLIYGINVLHTSIRHSLPLIFKGR